MKHDQVVLSRLSMMFVKSFARSGWWWSGFEEAASFADRFVDAVEGGGAVAVAVAEEALVVGGDSGHDLAGGAGGELVGVVVGFDCGGDAEVLVGDGAVGDARVGEGHLHRAVSEECCDGFEAHATVDGLGGEGVAELVRVDVSDAGSFGDGGDVAVDAAPVEWSAVVAFDE